MASASGRNAQLKREKEKDAGAAERLEKTQPQQSGGATVSQPPVQDGIVLKKDSPEKPATTTLESTGETTMATQAPPPPAAPPPAKTEIIVEKGVSLGEVIAKIGMVPQDRYQIRRDINLGGQGACKVAFDQIAEREVVLKSSGPQGGWSAERIIKEARIAAKFNHPHVVRLLELGAFGKDQVFMTMPYIEGSSLDVVIKKISETGIPGLTGYSVTAIAELFDKICSGIEHAHGAGYLHLDLKPQNVVVGNKGEVTVVDWGVSQCTTAEPGKRFATSETPVANPTLNTTLAGSMANDPTVRAIGTPAFMAPEQWSGDPGTFSERTDVYGLGGVLFYLLTGGVPNQVQRPQDLEPYFRHSPVPSPSEHTRRRVPPELESLCVQCLARDPAQRVASVFHVRHILKSWLGRPEMWELYRTN